MTLTGADVSGRMGRRDQRPRQRGRQRSRRGRLRSVDELRPETNATAQDAILPIDRATFQPGEYGRMIRSDGTERWWVRSSRGSWIALSHQRVMDNSDGTITLLYLK